MNFKEKYTTDPLDKEKRICVTQEAYLFAEMIDDLKNTLERMRSALK